MLSFQGEKNLRLSLSDSVIQKMKVLVAQSFLTLTPWTGTRQAPLSVEFCRPEYWNG